METPPPAATSPASPKGEFSKGLRLLSCCAVCNGMAPPPSTASTCESGNVIDHLTRIGASAMNTTTVGGDLAKSVFQVHGVDARGKAVPRRQLRREQVAASL
jgi:hypothetical protein